MKAHMNLRHSMKKKNSTFSCDICDKDFTTKSNLTAHLKNEHTESSYINCSDCEEQFENNWNLKNHRRDDHEITEICQHFVRGSCKFPKSVCWLKHEKTGKTKSIEVTNIKCYVCNRDFRTKNAMMIHKKKFHAEETKKCIKYQKGVCTLDEDECWYIHSGRGGGGAGTETSEEADSSDNENKQQGFQKAQRKPVPPNIRN